MDISQEGGVFVKGPLSPYIFSLKRKFVSLVMETFLGLFDAKIQEGQF